MTTHPVQRGPGESPEKKAFLDGREAGTRAMQVLYAAAVGPVCAERISCVVQEALSIVTNAFSLPKLFYAAGALLDAGEVPGYDTPECRKQALGCYAKAMQAGFAPAMTAYAELLAATGAADGGADAALRSAAGQGCPVACVHLSVRAADAGDAAGAKSWVVRALQRPRTLAPHAVRSLLGADRDRAYGVLARVAGAPAAAVAELAGVFADVGGADMAGTNSMLRSPLWLSKCRRSGGPFARGTSSRADVWFVHGTGVVKAFSIVLMQHKTFMSRIRALATRDVGPPGTLVVHVGSAYNLNVHSRIVQWVDTGIVVVDPTHVGDAGEMCRIVHGYGIDLLRDGLLEHLRARVAGGTALAIRRIVLGAPCVLGEGVCFLATRVALEEIAVAALTPEWREVSESDLKLLIRVARSAAGDAGAFNSTALRAVRLWVAVDPVARGSGLPSLLREVCIGALPAEAAAEARADPNIAGAGLAALFPGRKRPRGA